MLRSMYAGISGLKNHQVRMDVIGNNIANVNTVGYKKSRVTFQDILSQTIRGGAAPQAGRGGTNPQQVGLGMAIGNIDTIHTPGNTQTTGVMTDLAIEGDGFFMVGNEEGQTFFTRAGNFTFDRDGNFADGNGMLVKGWRVSSDGNIDNTGRGLDAIEPLKITVGEESGANATTKVGLSRNLDSEAEIGREITAPINIYDKNGRSYDLEVIFRRDGENDWEYAIRARTSNEDWQWAQNPNADLEHNIDGAENWSNVTFNDNGTIIQPESLTINIGPEALSDDLPTEAMEPITLDFSAITQYAAPSSVQADYQNGYSSGTLQSVVVDSTGVILGVFSNGTTKSLGQVATAIFKNPGGLISQGGNLYTTSNNSGNPEIGPSGTGGRGTIAPGSLEMSNVDLSEEFVDMITTQRGFQANSRIITTSDEMLQELVNLKR